MKVSVKWNFWLPWAGFTGLNDLQATDFLKEKSLSLGHTSTASYVLSFSPLIFCLNLEICSASDLKI